MTTNGVLLCCRDENYFFFLNYLEAFRAFQTVLSRTVRTTMKFLQILTKIIIFYIQGKGSENSLQFEIQDSVRSSRKSSKRSSRLGSSKYSSDTSSIEGHDFKRAFNTYKIVTANKMPRGAGFGVASPVPVTRGYQPGQGSSLDNSVKDRSSQNDDFFSSSEAVRYLPNDSMYSYTVSRDESRSPTDFLDLSDEFEGMMSTSYDEFCSTDESIKNANCLSVNAIAFTIFYNQIWTNFYLQFLVLI